MPEFRQYLVPWGSKVLIIRSDWDLMKWYDSHRKSAIFQKYNAFIYQNSGILVLKFWCHGFFSLGISMPSLFVPWKNASESRCRDLVVSISWYHGVLVPNLDVMVFLSCYLDVVVFWSWDLDPIYMSPQPRFCFH